VDIGKSIRLAVDTGKVKFGSREAVHAALNGEAKLIIVAGNCPATVKNDLEYYCNMSQLSTLKFAGTSVELGSICGKPFPICALVVNDAGTSDIMDAIKQG